MGYLGRRIGLSQDKGDSTPGGADGAVGGGILDLLAHGYFERQDKIYNAPVAPPSGLTATGGVIGDYMDPGSGNIYRTHTFTTSGVFNVTAIGDHGSNVDYLVVAGGGGGGNAHSTNAAGGGGAGGLRSSHPDAPSPMRGSAYTVSTTNPYTVTVGGGGAALKEDPTNGYSRKGNNSEFYPTPVGSGHPTGIFAHGGGAGAAHEYTPDPEMNGGSGGGGDTYDPPQPEAGGSTTSGTGHGPTVQGFAGGASQFGPPGHGGGGGGGAGEAGNTDGHGYGGDGLQIKIAGPPTFNGIGAPGPSSSYQWFAGGGGGEYSPGTGTPGRPGGTGGGGDASTRNVDSCKGLSSTGGGGAATKNNPSTHNGILGNGGSGIVILRYQIGSISAQKATGGAVSFAGGKTIHTFLASGSLVVDGGPISADYLVIGGGGGGGSFDAGGGGAAALHYATGQSIANGTYPVTVGAGGGAGLFYPLTTARPGSNSTLALPSSVSSSAGGGGGPYRSSGGNGGSGGGGGGEPGSGGTGSGDSGHPGGIDQTSPANGWGNDGARGTDSASTQPTYGGGGGGAAAAGDNGVTGPPYDNARAGSGGDGARYSISGTTRYYAGGGGGGSQSNPGGGAPLQPVAGQGGGGRGGYGSSVPADQSLGDDAEMNTGSGGGGGGQGNPSNKPHTSSGGNGGSGIVIVAYPT